MSTVCPICGAENRTTARFCHQCGQRLAEVTPPVSADSTEAEAIEVSAPGLPPAEPGMAMAADAAEMHPLVQQAGGGDIVEPDALSTGGAEEGAADESGVVPSTVQSPEMEGETVFVAAVAADEARPDADGATPADPAAAAELRTAISEEITPLMLTSVDSSDRSISELEPAPFMGGDMDAEPSSPAPVSAPMNDVMVDSLWTPAAEAALALSSDDRELSGSAAAEAGDEPVAAPATALSSSPALPIAAPEKAAPGLATGTLVAGRFAVTGVTVGEGGVVEYTVEDRGICRGCGALVVASPEEPYCFECGAYLLDEVAPWPLRRLLLAEAGAPEPATGELLLWAESGFWLLPLSLDVEGAGTAGGQPRAFTRGVNLLVGQRSDVGVLRAGNPDEDSIFTLTVGSVFDSKAQPTVGLYLVADGMGGHGDGEVASRIVVETLGTALIQTVVLPLLQGQHFGEEALRALMDAAIQSANRRVVENARIRHNDMGATLTLALVIDDQLLVANVGDSRTYLWQDGELRQITEDHSAVFQLYRRGMLTEAEIYTHPRRNEIVRSMGLRGEVQVDYFRETVRPGDELLLCCDGLWEMIHNDGIGDVLLTHYGDPQATCDELVKRANLAGGEDNVSVVIVRAMA